MTAALPMTAGPSTSKPASLPDSWIERIFARMEDRYGDLWANRYGAFPRERVKATWAEDLADLTGEEIKAGMTACRNLRFPPTCPEFRELCRPQVDPKVAWYEAVNGCEERAHGRQGEWSHPAVYWAAQEVGPYDIRTQGYSVLGKRWQAALDKHLKRNDLQPVPEPSAALPAPGKAMATREQAAQHLEQLGATGVLKPMAQAKEVGNKAWAQKIIDNPSAYPFISLKFAREALGLDADGKPIEQRKAA